MMHRYYGSRRNLSGMIPALGLPPSEAPRLGYNLVDDYSDGPLVLNSTPTMDSEDGLRVDPAIAPWPGAENPRRFTDVQQLLIFPAVRRAAAAGEQLRVAPCARR